MKKYTILVPTDFSKAARCALAHAIKMATVFDGEIHLLHIVEIPTASVPDLPLDFIEVLQKRAIDDLKAEVKQFGEDIPPITSIVRSGVPTKAPAEIILEYANDLKPDLLVMGTHGRRGARRLLLGSVTEEITRRSGFPVLTIRSHKKAELIPGIHQILVPVDFSEKSDQIVEKAAEIALKVDASMVLMHVVDIEFYPFYGFTTDPVKLIERNMIDVAMTKLNDMVADLRSRGIRANWEADTGHAARVVVDYANRNQMDMIVMGSHGRSGFDRLMLGSVAEKVLRSANSPVLIVNTAVIPHEMIEEPLVATRINEFGWVSKSGI